MRVQVSCPRLERDTLRMRPNTLQYRYDSPDIQQLNIHKFLSIYNSHSTAFLENC